MRMRTAQLLPEDAAGFSQLATFSASFSMSCSNVKSTTPATASCFATSFTGSTGSRPAGRFSKLAGLRSGWAMRFAMSRTVIGFRQLVCSEKCLALPKSTAN